MNNLSNDAFAFDTAFWVCNIDRTSEGGWLQQPCAESPLMKKPHQPHILVLVTQRD